MPKQWDFSVGAATETLQVRPDRVSQGKPLPTINVLVITRRVTEVRVLQMYSA